MATLRHFFFLTLTSPLFPEKPRKQWVRMCSKGWWQRVAAFFFSTKNGSKTFGWRAQIFHEVVWAAGGISGFRRSRCQICHSLYSYTCCSYFVQTWWLCRIPSQPPFGFFLFCFFLKRRNVFAHFRQDGAHTQKECGCRKKKSLSVYVVEFFFLLFGLWKASNNTSATDWNFFLFGPVYSEITVYMKYFCSEYEAPCKGSW